MKRKLVASLAVSAALTSCATTATQTVQRSDLAASDPEEARASFTSKAIGSPEGLYTRLSLNHEPSSPTASARVHIALTEAAAHMHVHSEQTQHGSVAVEFEDSAVRRAWLIVDRGVNLASIRVSPAADQQSALLEALRRQSEAWAPGMLAIRVLHSADTQAVQLYDRTGTMNADAVDSISAAMLDWRSEEVRSIDSRLIAILYRVSRHFEKPLTLVSGYRVRGINASDGSRHGSGRAADIIVSGESSRAVSAYVDATFCNVGVGVYPNSGFVHIDVRDRSYFWTDRSGTNQRSREQARSPDVVARCEDDPTIRTVHINEREFYLPTR